MSIYDMAAVSGDYENWCRRFYPVPAVADGPGLLNAAGGGCLAASAASDGASVGIATCAAGATQTWTAGANSRVLGAGNRCLGLNGSAAVIEPCTGAADQNWTFLSNGQLRGAGRTCLTRSGNAVTAETCTANTSGPQYFPPASQRWNF